MQGLIFHKVCSRWLPQALLAASRCKTWLVASQSQKLISVTAEERNSSPYTGDDTHKHEMETSWVPAVEGQVREVCWQSDGHLVLVHYLRRWNDTSCNYTNTPWTAYERRLLLHDKARSHSAKAYPSLFQCSGCEILKKKNRACSLHLAPSDYHLFHALSKYPGGHEIERQDLKKTAILRS